MHVFERLWVMLNPEQMQKALGWGGHNYPLLVQAIKNTNSGDVEACAIINFVFKLPKEMSLFDEHFRYFDLVKFAVRDGTKGICEAIWRHVSSEMPTGFADSLFFIDLLSYQVHHNDRDFQGVVQFLEDIATAQADLDNDD